MAQKTTESFRGDVGHGIKVKLIDQRGDAGWTITDDIVFEMYDQRTGLQLDVGGAVTIVDQPTKIVLFAPTAEDVAFPGLRKVYFVNDPGGAKQHYPSRDSNALFWALGD